MKKLLLSASFILIVFIANAQVGIGTETPNSSSQLEIVSSNRGVLIPRVKLIEKVNPDPVTDPAKSLLVFNTATQNDVTPGFYYWYNNQWNRLSISAGGLNTTNISFTIYKDSLSVNDSEGNSVRVALSDVAGNEVLASRIANNPTFVKELASSPPFVDSMAGIVKDKETLTTLTDNGDGTYTYTNEDGVDVIFPVSQSGSGNPNTNGLSGSAGDIYVDKSTGDIYTYNGTTWVGSTETLTGVAFDPTTGIFTYTDEDGTANTLDLGAMVPNLETTTTVTDNGDGTYTFTNEDGISSTIDVKGNETVTTLVNNGDGTYTYTSEDGTITTIDIPANVLSDLQDNSSSIYQEVVDIIKNNETLTKAEFDPATGSFTYTDEDGTANTLDLGAMVPNLETTTTVTYNGDGTYAFTNEDGVTTTIDVKGNETVTTLIDNGDGTYTYTSEDGTVTIIDSTSAQSAIYDNSTSGLTSTDAQGAIDELANSLQSGAGVTLVDNADGTVTLQAADGSTLGTVNKATVTDHGDGTYTYDNGNGSPVSFSTNAKDLNYDNNTSGLTADNVQDAIDEINTALANTSDTLVDNRDGTYTHTAVDGTKVTINANTTSVTEHNGVYTFTDGADSTIAIINTHADHVAYDNSASGLTSTDAQGAIDELANSLQSGAGVTLTDNGDGTVTLKSADGSDLGTVGKATLTDNGDGTYTYDNGNGSPVTFSTNAKDLNYDNSTSGLTADNVQDAIDEINTALANTSDTLVDNGNGTYTHTAVDGTVVTIDANTTSVTEHNGVYTFTDGADSTIATINTHADHVAYDNSTSGLTSTDAQGAIDELANSLQSGAGVTLVDNGDGTVTLQAADGSTLGTVNKATLTDHGDGTYTYDNGNGSPVNFSTNAKDLNYDNSTSGLAADNVQDAIDEINTVLANTSDTLVDNGNGTYTHTAVDGTKVTIDANTTSVTEHNGVYTFTDGADSTIATINTHADHVAYDNSTSGLTSTDAQGAIDELANSLQSGAGVTLVDNGDGTVTLQAADGSTLGTVNKATLTDHGDGTYTYDNGNGSPVSFSTNAKDLNYDNTNSGLAANNVQDAIDEINNVLANTSDTLIDNGNGTYTHTAVDGTKVTIDANTTHVTEHNGVYTFTDGADSTIATINTHADHVAYDNSTSGLTSTDAQGAIDELANGLQSGAGVTLVDNADGTVTLQAADGSTLGTVNKATLTDHGDGTYTYDNGNGSPVSFSTNAKDLNYDNTNSGLTADNVQDAIDEINNALANTSDTLVDNRDGTYTHTAVDGTVVTIDTVNSANSIYDNSTTGLTATNVQDAIDEINHTLANTSDTLSVADGHATHIAVDGAKTEFDVTQSGVGDPNGNGTTGAAGDVYVDESTGDIYTYNSHTNSWELAAGVEKGNLTAATGNRVKITNGQDAVLKDITLDVNEANLKLQNIGGTLQVDQIQDGNANEILMTNAGGNGVTWGNASVLAQGDLTSNDLTITNGTSSILNDVQLEIGQEVITSDNIKDGEVTATDLGAEPADAGKVGVVQPDGTVVYQNVAADNVEGKDLTAGDASITVTDGTGATLVNSNIKVSDSGITNAKLAPDAVTSDKIQDGDVQTNDLTDGAVTSDKVGADAVTSDKIQDGEVTATDLGAEPADAGKVGVVQPDGTVVYQNVAADNVEGKDLTAGDGSITVTDGTGATLVNSNIKVSDSGITNAKLAPDAVTSDKIQDGEVANSDLGADAVTSDKIKDGEVKATDLGAEPADAGKVGVVQPDGTVVYQNVAADNVEGKDLTAGDASITVTDGTGATLVNSNIKVSDSGITNIKLAPDAVTSDKIQDGDVQTNDLADGAVTNDKVGADAVTSDKIQDGEVKATDLGAEPADAGKVATVQADGTVVYKTPSTDATNVTNAKTLSNTDGSITVTDGTGATLVDAQVKVTDGGITNAKLATDAVTSDKIKDGEIANADLGAEAVTSDKIKDGEVNTDDVANSAVTTDKIQGGGNDMVLVTDNTGNPIWVDKNTLVQSNETITTLEKNSNGTYTYTSEDGTATIIDTTNAGYSIYDDTNSGLNADNTQDAIDSLAGRLANTSDTLKIAGGHVTHIAVDGTKTEFDITQSGSGDPITNGTTGAAGDVYVDESTGDVYTYNSTANTWEIANPETVTTLEMNAGTLEYVNEDTTNADVPLISTDANNAITAGTDGALFVADSLAKNIYNSNGTLTGARSVFGTENWLMFYGDNGSIQLNGNDLRSANTTGGVTDLYYNGNTARLHVQGTSDALEIGTHATDDPAPITFVTSPGGTGSSVERMRITGTGDIGIGTQTPTELLDIDGGNVRIRDINGNTGTSTDKIVVADADGVLKTVDAADLAITTATADNGLTKTSNNIQLGGALIKPTVITADATNTLAVKGLQDGAVTDSVVVVDANGVLKKLKAVMPKFFYMPSIVMPTAAVQLGTIPYGNNEITENGGIYTVKLYDIYNEQFSGTGTNSVSSPGAGSLPTLGATDLYYHITYYDSEVFTNVSVDANGVLTYQIAPGATVDVASFMNVVFEVK